MNVATTKSLQKDGIELNLKPPFPPMEALLVKEIPLGSDWRYEPKWDGFRCLVFRDGAEIFLQSKAGQPLHRYFPEMVDAIEKLSARDFVLDGELVIPAGQSFSFDDLLQRIHPAKSRIEKLSREHPAILIVFDLLEEGGELLVGKPFADRRARLEKFAHQFLVGNDSIRLSPSTPDVEMARRWFAQAGASLDGIIAKRADLDYRSGERTGMQKYKHIQTVDCVVGGFRYGSKTDQVGSLLLGLYDESGLLHHVGFTSGIKAADRTALTTKLEKLIKAPGFTGRAPGGPSRWSSERSGEWKPLAAKLVAEVAYDHFTQGRFRHGTKFVRWRPDKAPEQCKFDQVDQRCGRPMVLLGES
jgi:ATP-dependent DNA ligase